MTTIISDPNKTIPATTESQADTANAITAEIARLKSPEPAFPDREADRTVIGRRIQEETKAGDAWIKQNLSREQRRALSIDTAFGAICGGEFFRDEPPLYDDSWDELIERQARRIVGRRAETGCPTFELWGRPAPVVHTWPKVTVRATTPEERAKALAKGTRALARLVAGEEHKLRSLRAMLHLARSIGSDPKTLADTARAEAWENGLDVLDNFYASGCEVPDAGERLAEFARDAEYLAIVSGDHIYASGGDLGDEFYPSPRSYIDVKIAEYGITEGGSFGCTSPQAAP